MNPNPKKPIQFLDLNNSFLIICLLLFSVFLIKTYQMEDVSSYLLPRMLCIFGIVVILIMIISGYLKTDAVNDKKKEAIDQKTGIHIGYSIAFATAYFFITRTLGFMLTTCIAIIAFSCLMRFQNKKLLLILSAAIPLILHYAFVVLLKASLPAGIVENLFF